MHESSYTQNNDGIDLRSEFHTRGALPPDFMIPGGIALTEEERGGFKLTVNPSMDARSHGILEAEFFAYHPDDRQNVLDDYAQLFPTAIFKPDNHLFLVVGGKPKFALVDEAVPIMHKEFIMQDDPNVIGFHSNMLGGDDTRNPFFEYYIAQEDTSFIQEETRVMALVTVGIRIASNDFGSINEEIKRLARTGGASETKIRELVDPYLRIRLRPIPNKPGPDIGGEGISNFHPIPPKVPDGQYAEREEIGFDTFTSQN